ncbi:MAG: hypothetical protein EPN22_09605 [Nitrospirae bacterium]|nr:MAG: hypothetical protein EPN22_09605 [Nitrospirota bacterium]
MKNKINRYVKFINSGDIQFFVYMPAAIGLLILFNYDELKKPDLIPVMDSLAQFTEFLYAVSAYQNHELPLWNSYLYGGQPFYLLMNHGLLLNPIVWIWIILGTLIGLTHLQIYVWYHLTEIVFYALGGFFLVRRITKNNIAALIGFIILLFSGDAAYWVNQIYIFTIIMPVPWILFLGLRYFDKQTVPNAFVAAFFLGITLNVYYPIYLIAFLSITAVFLALFYFRAMAEIDHKKLFRHLLLTVPLIAVLVLPTYFAYTEINNDYYQISRYSSEEQVNAVDVPLEHTSHVALADIAPLMLVPQRGFHDATALIGTLAFVFMLSGLLSRSKASLLWTGIFIAMCLNIAGRHTPFFYLGYLLVPFYKLIRSFSFFSGFISFSAAVLACIGVGNLLRKISSFSPDMSGIYFWRRETLIFLLFIGLIFYLPEGHRLYPALAAAALAAVFFLVIKRPGDKRSLVLFGHIAIAAFLVIGAFNLSLIKGSSLEIPGFFNYTGRFGFSFDRPDEYLSIDEKTNKSIPFTNIGDKTDAPWYFDDWGSDNTLFVDRQYYHRSKTMGFDGMMKKKLHFLKYYTVYDKALNYNFFIDKSILVLRDENNVGNKNAGLELDRVEDIEEREEILPAALFLNKKTANRVVFDITVNEDVFLLYTDRYHKGFKAAIDGKEVPVLKGMDIFKAVELPAGKHLVEFVFQPFYGYVLIIYLAVAVGFYLVMLVCGTVKIYESVVRSYRCNFLSP